MRTTAAGSDRDGTLVTGGCGDLAPPGAGRDAEPSAMTAAARPGHRGKEPQRSPAPE